MPSKLTRTTTDHDEIRRWAEERDGQPAEVERTERDGETGIIRLDFPGYKGAGSLKHISWDEWFQKFDDSGLALVYQEHTAGGQRSNFNKLVGRETANARRRGDNRASRRSLRSGGRRMAGRRQGATRTAGRRGGSRSASSTSAGKRTRRSAARDTGRSSQRRGRGSEAREGARSREAPRAIAARLTGRGHMGEESGRRTSRRSPGRSRKSAGSSGARSGRRSTTRTGRTPRGRHR